MHIYPAEFFVGRDFTVEPDLCFTIMPFTEPWSERTYAVIKETVEEMGYRCVRADDFYGKVVLSDIWELLNRAGFVIADLTNENPNVYYELGIAQTLGKDIIPLLQVGGHIPFDQQPFRILFYEDNRDGEALLKSRLPQWISSLDYSASPQMLLKRGRVSDFNRWRAQNEAPNITRADLAGLGLPGVNFDLAFLSESSFAHCDFSGATLRDAVLIRCILREANFSNADLFRTNLSEARLEGAVLDGADMRESVLIRTRFDGASLKGVNVEGATIDAFTLNKYPREFSDATGVELLIVESG